jgi:glutamate-1-semialdehyde 2,1-aminomutase
MDRKKSEEAYQEAIQYIPGGVNSPVRALKSVGETPLFIRSAAGTQLTDVDGNLFTDFCLSWGVFVLGHSYPAVNQAAINAIANGTSYGIPSLSETGLAKLVTDFIRSIERVRFVNSGTEAVMSAIRLARGFTRKNIIVKFDGCYHGHADHLLVSSGSGVANLTGASSAGVPSSFVDHTVSLPFNDKKSVEQLFKERGSDIAAIIVEPVPANMGVVLPQNGFLEFLRSITSQNKALLIFDEVITGFRLARGGAQELFGIKPDLTTVGKIVGGGFPAAAFGGRKEIMALLAPDGPVYQAGTLSGNPVAMSAGIATLTELSGNNFYADLNKKAEQFVQKLKSAIAGKNMVLNHIGPMFTLFFTSGSSVSSFADVKQTDLERFAHFFRYVLNHGFYISPSQFEANFVSIAHNDKELERFVEVVQRYKE